MYKTILNDSDNTRQFILHALPHPIHQHLGCGLSILCTSISCVGIVRYTGDIWGLLETGQTKLHISRKMYSSKTSVPLPLKVFRILLVKSYFRFVYIQFASSIHDTCSCLYIVIIKFTETFDHDADVGQASFRFHFQKLNVQVIDLLRRIFVVKAISIIHVRADVLFEMAVFGFG